MENSKITHKSHETKLEKISVANKISKTTKSDFLIPILAAFYPVLFLFVHNSSELHFSELLLPFSFGLFIAAYFWILARLIFRNNLMANAVSGFATLLFFSFPICADLLSKVNVIRPIYVELVILFILFLSMRLLLWKVKSISSGLKLALIILVAFNIGSLIYAEVDMLDFTKSDLNMDTIDSSLVSNQTPDIYYIVLDEYGSVSTMQNVYNYSNQPFVDYLETIGFKTITNNTAESNDTFISTARSLNMERLKINGDRNAYPLINDNKVMQFLRSKGYKIVVLDGLVEYRKTKGRFKNVIDIRPKAEDLFDYLTTDFNILVLESTIFNPYVKKKSGSIIVKRHRNYVLSQFKDIPETASIKGPKFVFAHIVCPHVTFTFGRNGEQVSPQHGRDWLNKEYYLNQYIFVTKSTQKMVSELVQRSNNSIIIIQSDHGVRTRTSEVRLQNIHIPVSEGLKVFYVYRMPGVNLTCQNIYPHDTFRLIFNKYFGENLSIQSNCTFS